MKISKSDQEELDDYRKFRRARAIVFVHQKEWHMMSKKTKRALTKVFDILAKQNQTP